MDDDISYLLLEQECTQYGTVSEGQLLRLSDHFSVPEAAACIIGVKPSYIDATNNSLQIKANIDSRNCITPINAALDTCYKTLKTEITLNGLSAIIEYTALDFDTAELCPESITAPEIDWINVKISREDLISWLDKRGLKSEFFSPPKKSSEPDYLNVNHPRYSPKLAAAVQAWLAFEDSELYQGKGITDALKSWLEMNYKKLGLTHQGKKSQNAIEQVVSVTNWNSKGGSPKTPG